MKPRGKVLLLFLEVEVVVVVVVVVDVVMVLYLGALVVEATLLLLRRAGLLRGGVARGELRPPSDLCFLGVGLRTED